MVGEHPPRTAPGVGAGCRRRPRSPNAGWRPRRSQRRPRSAFPSPRTSWWPPSASGRPGRAEPDRSGAPPPNPSGTHLGISADDGTPSEQTRDSLDGGGQVEIDSGATRYVQQVIHSMVTGNVDGSRPTSATPAWSPTSRPARRSRCPATSTTWGCTPALWGPAAAVRRTEPQLPRCRRPDRTGRARARPAPGASSRDAGPAHGRRADRRPRSGRCATTWSLPTASWCQSGCSAPLAPTPGVPRTRPVHRSRCIHARCRWRTTTPGARYERR